MPPHELLLFAVIAAACAVFSVAVVLYELLRQAPGSHAAPRHATREAPAPAAWEPRMSYAETRPLAAIPFVSPAGRQLRNAYRP
jgi:hypothetical protein